MRDHARLIAIAAVEAVEEVDTVARRPELLDALTVLASDAEFTEATERVAPGVMREPGAQVARLAQDLEPYRDKPLDDAPELVERLAFVAWVLQQAVRDDQPTSDQPALSVA